MRTLIILLVCVLNIISHAQDNPVYQDYLIFGRKEPISLGSLFSGLANEPIYQNPANVALVTDNSITIGGSVSDQGNSYMLSWTTPNLSISSARQITSFHDSLYREYKKELLKFSFGISNTDIGFSLGNTLLAFGIAVRTVSDKLYDSENGEFGGDAVGVDLGLHLSWKYISFEMAMLNLNAPNVGDTDISYERALSLTTRYRSPSGFEIAFQGISSSSYAGADMGINISAQQKFLDSRLTSRIQLTSFFSGTEAVMQNISGSVGYRPVVPQHLYFLQDFEFNYALSFLAMPRNVGTHLFVITKYF